MYNLSRGLSTKTKTLSRTKSAIRSCTIEGRAIEESNENLTIQDEREHEKYIKDRFVLNLKIYVIRPGVSSYNV